MDAEQFREFGYAAIDFAADYTESLRERPVLPSVQQGYLNVLPDHVPERPESWKDVMNDIHDKIVPGVTNWQSPQFHAYFPLSTSYSSIVGDIIANAFGGAVFSWIANPAGTELEMKVMDWLVKFLNLPEEFSFKSKTTGGGVIHGSASEAIFVAMVTAREQAVRRLQLEHPNLTESEIRGKLVMYSSNQSNGTVEKQARCAGVPIRLLSVDPWTSSMRGDTLMKAVKEDIQNGLFPIACIATLGTTPTCAFDNIPEIGPICRENKIWLHIDAAYAGSALCCEELRSLMPGIDFADSLGISLYKWMMLSHDCCATWFKDTSRVVDSLTMDRAYLKHNFGQSEVPEYRHLHTGLTRRFRALKVWVMLRTVGGEKIRENIRNHIRLAQLFENKVRSDGRFEIAAAPALGLVCFRLKNGCAKTQQLLEKINERKRIHMVPSLSDGKWMIRFLLCAPNSEERDIHYAWNEILSVTELILESKMVEEKLSTEFANNIQIYNDAAQLI